MSALSLPANPALAQSKPASPSNNASNGADEVDTPFASVLKQKVQDSKEGQDKPADAAATPAPGAQAAAEKAENPDTTSPSAMALATGEYAQDALQQLLPWLQAMQGQNAQPRNSDTPEASESLLPETLIVPQTQAAQSGPQVDPKQVKADDAGKEVAELPPELLKDGKTAATTANLAVATEALTNGNKPGSKQESFDTTLQGVNQRLDAQMQSGATQNTSRGSEPVRLQSALGTPQWQAEFSDRVQFMSRNNESRAELVLTPPQLGRIEVSLNINGDQASALFVSANPEVRTALEAAMDRLREALASNGITLGQADVGSESSGQSAGNESGGQRQAGGIAGGTQEVAAGAWTRHSNNMLDVFA